MGTITRKIHHTSEEYGAYRAAKVMTSSSGSFEYDGHRWKYQFTSFDDAGDYDVIFRFDHDDHDIAAEDMTLFDALLCNALAGLCANPSFYDDVVDERGKNQVPSLLAQDAYDVAMEAYNLVRSRR